jgi:hypothetical protein
VGEPDLSWVDWGVQGFTGIEIWNYMSEFKSALQNPAALIWYVFFPSTGIRGPFPKTMAIWDGMLAAGLRVAGIGSSDAHGTVHSAGPLRRVVFPYGYLFGTVNTHLLIPRPFSYEAKADSALVVDALRAGRGWVGYDLSRSTRGFQYYAESAQGHAEMGGEMPWRETPVLQAVLPSPATIRLIRAGSGTVWQGKADRMAYQVIGPGAYRMEVWRVFRGRLRGWIFSNPIYISD